MIKMNSTGLKPFNLSSYILAAVFMALAACSPAREDTSAHEPNEPGDVIQLSREQMKAVGIITGPPELKNLRDIVKANGQLQVPPQNKAEVHPLLGGIIKKIFVQEGSFVRKGQALVSIKNPDLVRVQQDYLASRSALALAGKEYERQKELMAENAGTGKVYQQAEAAYQSEQARLRVLTRQLKQMGIGVAEVDRGAVITTISVLAPISGVVGKIAATTGSYAETSQALMSIIDNSRVHCDLLVYEKDLFKVEVGQSVDFVLTNQSKEPIKGLIYGINKSFENDTKAVIAHVRIDNGARRNLIPGMYASALINVGQQRVLAVPQDAVVSAQGKSYVFVAEEGEHAHDTHEDAKDEVQEDHYSFKRQEVVTGVSELGYVEIKPLTPFPAGVQIVTRAAFYLQSKAVGGVEHDH